MACSPCQVRRREGAPAGIKRVDARKRSIASRLPTTPPTVLSRRPGRGNALGRSHRVTAVCRAARSSLLADGYGRPATGRRRQSGRGRVGWRSWSAQPASLPPPLARPLWDVRASSHVGLGHLPSRWVVPSPHAHACALKHATPPWRRTRPRTIARRRANRKDLPAGFRPWHGHSSAAPHIATGASSPASPLAPDVPPELEQATNAGTATASTLIPNPVLPRLMPRPSATVHARSPCRDFAT